MGSIYAMLPGVLMPLMELMFGIDNVIGNFAGSVDGVFGSLTGSLGSSGAVPPP